MGFPHQKKKKRPWVAAGLSLLLFEESCCCASASVQAQAQQERQHRVPVANRKVPYAHVLQGRSRADSHEAFYKPTAKERHDRRIYPDDGEVVVEPCGVTERMVHDGDVHWHLVADANTEQPDAIFRHIKNSGSEPSPWYGVQDPASWRNPLQWLFGRNLRRVEQVAQGNPSSVKNSDGAGDETSDGDYLATRSGNTTADFNLTVETSSLGPDVGTNDTGTAVFTKAEPTNATAANAISYQPLRIRAILAEKEGGGEHLSVEQHDILLQDVIRPALLSWSAALRVEPVVGNLTVDATQLYDGVSCGPGQDSGLPSVAVPVTHFQEGVPDTDIIVYLSLGFVEGNRTSDQIFQDVNSSAATMASGFSTQDPFFANAPTTFPLNLADKSVFGKKRTCSGDYLAASSFCSSDQYDRPTAAMLHICIGESFFDPESLQTNIMTAMHELGHALGFNAHSMAHFRRPDGSPITPRVNGEVPVSAVECTGTHNSRFFANMTVPSPEILQFRNVRGGVRVAEIVTPSVRQVVRNHFGCQELFGAELESGEPLPLSSNVGEISCLGDHWERRLFKSDLMNPVVDGLEFNPRLSTTTLAYFADSGWYQVDLSRSALSASWGRGAGCAFVEENCISDDGQVPPTYEPYFCNESPAIDLDGFATEINGCTPDLTRKASCSIWDHGSELPEEYQYFNFTFGANVGGSDAFIDYCPVFAGFTNGLCSDDKNEALIRVNRMEKIGARNSRCLAGHSESSPKAALCLPIACVVEDRSLRVQVEGIWRTCHYKDQELLARSGDRVVCPDPIRVCPTFYCDRDCLGTSGWCNYGSGMCICNATAVLPDEDIAAESFFDSYRCEQDVEEESGKQIFYSPDVEDDLPESDSPLADYYVPTARLLRDQPDLFLKPWALSVVTLASLFVLVVMVLGIHRKRQAAEQDSGNEPGTDDDGNSMINPNKDKMLAAVVVDIRIHGPNFPRDVLRERASETDISLTDTEGSGARDPATRNTPLGELEPVVIDSPPSSPVVRRRNVHTILDNF